MAGVSITIPGVAGTVEAKATAMARAVQQQFDIVTAAPEQKVRRPSAGDLGKRLTTARLA
jgi:hypothetical protein